MADQNDTSRSHNFLAAADRIEHLANTAPDQEGKTNLLELASLWRKLADMRARLERPRH